MPAISEIVNFRRQNRVKRSPRSLPALGLVTALVVSLLLTLLCLAGFWNYRNLTQDLPSLETIPALLEPPDGSVLQPTRLVDRSGEHLLLTLRSPAAMKAGYLSLSGDGHSPSQYRNIIDASLAAYEAGFWSSPGYSLRGIRTGEHPTIAQRLVSDLVLMDEPASLRRNLRERLLAAQLVDQFGRQKVLEWFLNQQKYGAYIYGAQAGAWAYFGKPAADLDLAEAALLTALTQLPDADPASHWMLLKQKQQEILRNMLALGMTGADTARTALREDVKLLTQPELVSLAPAFTDLVLKQLENYIPIEKLQRGGYQVTTTLDYELQAQAACTTTLQLGRAAGMSDLQANPGGPECLAASLLPTLKGAENRSSSSLAAEVVIIDPRSGQVLVLTGQGVTIEPAHPVSSHPAGTILSPFLALAAFSSGMSPASMLWDIPPAGQTITATITSGSGVGVQSYHGPVRLRQAVVNDYQAALTSVWQQVGGENVAQTVQSFGLPGISATPGKSDLKVEFFDQEVTLLQAVSAYGVFANQGAMVGQPEAPPVDPAGVQRLHTTAILRVDSMEGADGRNWLDWKAGQSQSIVSTPLAYLVTHVLSDASARWPSLGHPNDLEIGRPAAAKSGASLDKKDAWVIGYVPQLVLGVWMGDAAGADPAIPSELPAGVWHALVQYATHSLPVAEFPVPAGISQVQVCDPSGMLVSPECPTIAQEVFLSGMEPVRVDDLYQKYQIDRDTGKLATIFTPPGWVEEKVYLSIPVEAMEWARLAGVPLPPQVYDNFAPPEAPNPVVQVSNLHQMEVVGGEIPIRGTAAGEGFQYYRLQVGQGINPQEWLQLGEDITQPVQDGVLGNWDTTGLAGTYILELQVVRTDQRVEQALIQLTVDNAPPSVNILEPAMNEKIPLQPGAAVMIRGEANDNVGLQRLEFYLDGSLVSTLVQRPWVIIIKPGIGEHTVAITAFDLAGNPSTTRLNFSVIK